MNNTKLTVIDFFSGAGGFSEGFRQQGFSVIMGIDFWEPAVNTHNLNHNLSDQPKNVLDFEGSHSGDTEEIDTLPASDIIIGSPSCVSFSMSNRAGKADKSDGVRLIESYLRAVAVKKHEKNSNLKAWLMENVPNSRKFVKSSYTFDDLNLKNWALANGYDPLAVALNLNGTVLNASSYSAPQNRKRFICGEFVDDGDFPFPIPEREKPISLKNIKAKMPTPALSAPEGIWQDPNYPNLKLSASDISDHFYDTGLYKIEWEQARYLKTMHPYMGKMSFPENENKPSRTVTATRSACSRESLIYKSERNRIGHGEYRLPTIREVASLMGYPYTYQFLGSESTKWRLVGNSVSPQLSSALAKAILLKLGLKPVPAKNINFNKQLKTYNEADNLNDFKERKFDNSKRRQRDARLRRALHKSGNMTVDLLNYNPSKTSSTSGEWTVCTFYGTGHGHSYDTITKQLYEHIGEILESEWPFFSDFIDKIDRIFRNRRLTLESMQKSYEEDCELINLDNPLVIIEEIKSIINNLPSRELGKTFAINEMMRDEFTLTQLLYIFSMSYILRNIICDASSYVLKESLVSAAEVGINT